MSSKVTKAELPQGEQYNLNIPISVTSEQTEHITLSIHTYENSAGEIIIPIGTLKSLLFSGSSVISQIEQIEVQDEVIVLKVNLDTGKMQNRHPVAICVWDVFKTRAHEAVVIQEERFTVHPDVAHLRYEDWPEKYQ